MSEFKKSLARDSIRICDISREQKNTELEIIIKNNNDQKANDRTWGKERTRLDNRIRDLQLQITKLYTEFRNLEKKKQASNPEILDQLPILLNIKFNYLLILIL